MIMVDELRQWPTNIRCFKSGSCHLTTDGTLDELHAFAHRLGMKREWFQDHRIAPHYDLTRSRRETALEYGAVFVPMREQVAAAKGQTLPSHKSTVSRARDTYARCRQIPSMTVRTYHESRCA